ncbi:MULTISPECIES: HipA domain-containing protein [Polaribacter]|jgi:serine/threonine-protein kinase HipA|uniref:HipA domain containing protein n=1 Tax=Polaribacter dokdonensis DSW-5 TaxID=1300348 RepID=A0A0M9CIF4_9FLAO|nr:MULTISPECIES: HipA domain-containing protein [Polaribacter]KOY53086.1 HipA domain containing protein [Polaribacter dokdonensis DSW-5]UAM98916.1 HipA domain-containing protein [Polaribacter litorisediminis]SEE56972.1 serine/threonine-protein kinase HipA [Polaribacter dokdonensis DSW-5]|tara:strand:+ start:8708 stop:9652 length:945 start_codon:yes stop_codon:yes gene_type:complete
MKTKKHCLYCYEALVNEIDFHERCALEFFGTTTPPELPYGITEMDALAKDVISRSIAVPGVQPKLSMSLDTNNTTKETPRLTVVGALGGNYIFKPPSLEFKEMPENEHLTMRIAEAFGINVVPSSLIRLTSGELSYITKRIDRTLEGDKIHMIDFFQITEAFDKYKSSMEKIGKAIGQYSSNTQLDKIFFFELALFSFLTGNNDMHLKNFSMIEGISGWTLAPAYDLLNVTIVLPEDTEELALTLAGKKSNLKKEHFEQLGIDLDLTDKQIKGVFKRILKNKLKAIQLINTSFLSNEMKTAYKTVLEIRYQRIE